MSFLSPVDQEEMELSFPEDAGGAVNRFCRLQEPGAPQLAAAPCVCLLGVRTGNHDVIIDFILIPNWEHWRTGAVTAVGQRGALSPQTGINGRNHRRRTSSW